MACRRLRPERVGHSLTTPEQTRPDLDAASEAIKRTLAECDRKLARHRAALEAGADPELVASWSRKVQAEGPRTPPD